MKWYWSFVCCFIGAVDGRGGKTILLGILFVKIEDFQDHVFIIWQLVGRFAMKINWIISVWLEHWLWSILAECCILYRNQSFELQCKVVVSVWNAAPSWNGLNELGEANVQIWSKSTSKDFFMRCSLIRIPIFSQLTLLHMKATFSMH